MTTDDAINNVLRQAAQDNGVMEIPRGSNRGARVEAMLAYTGLGGGYPWCAAAVCAWGIEALGKSWPVPHTADCDAILSWARRKGCLFRTDPKPGDIFLVLNAHNKNDAIHTGLVVRELANGQVITWEGNTNDDGSREGYKVCQRRRSTGNLVYVRWVSELGEAYSSESRLPEIPAYRVWVSPYGLFPKVQMRSGRPCAPVRALVAAILGLPMELTSESVQWLESQRVAVVNHKALPGTYLQTDSDGRSTAWAPVREVGEALGCVVSVGEMLDEAKSPTVTIGPPKAEKTESARNAC